MCSRVLEQCKRKRSPYDLVLTDGLHSIAMSAEDTQSVCLTLLKSPLWTMWAQAKNKCWTYSTISPFLTVSQYHLCHLGLGNRVVQFSSVQFEMVSTSSGKPTFTLSHLSEDLPVLCLKVHRAVVQILKSVQKNWSSDLLFQFPPCDGQFLRTSHPRSAGD